MSIYIYVCIPMTCIVCVLYCMCIISAITVIYPLRNQPVIRDLFSIVAQGFREVLGQLSSKVRPIWIKIRPT